MKETDPVREASHVVIDEAQDFGMMAYCCLHYCLRGCTYTIMGDTSQNIHFQYGLNDWEELKKLVLTGTYDAFGLLQKSYRNTVEIYRAKPDRFQIIDGKLMPALNTIDGMGDNAAIAVAEAAKDGKFLSRDDFRQRTKATKTVIDLMGDLGLLGDMPESNQLSLFDFA